MIRSGRLASLLAIALLLVPALGTRPVPGHHGRHRRHRQRPERRRRARAPRSSIKNTATNLERTLDDRRGRPLPRPAAAARPVPRDREPARASRRWCARASTLAVGQSVNLAAHAQGLERAGGDRRHGRRARDRDDAGRGLRPASTRRRSRACRTTAATSSTSRSSRPGVTHRAGARRRRAHDQRPEGHQQQRLGGRRRLQQPVLRRAARRPAAGLHLQPRRGPGGGGGGRGRQRRVRPLERRLRQRRDQVRHERRARHAARLLQGRRASSSAPKKADGTEAEKYDFEPAAVRLHARRPDRRRTRLFYFLAFDYQNGDSTKQTDPTRIEPRVVDYFASIGSPERERLDRRAPTTRASSSARSTGSSARSTSRRSATTTPGPSRRTAPSTSTPGA